jgi:hypothetical protein
MKRFFPQLSTSTFTAGNKMKRSLSRLSRRSRLALVLISFVAAATLISFAVSANRNAKSGTGVSPVNHTQDARATKPLTRIANRRTLTPIAPMPFVPTITATLDDNFPLASKKNPGDTINYTAVITNTAGTDASGVAYTDTLDNNTTLSGVVRVSPVTVNDSYTCTGNVSISVPVGSGVLVNDYLGQNPAVSTVFASDTTSTQGGTVTVNADGSFTYNPPANFTGADTFTYTLQNATGSSVGTVTINVSDRILFVNGAGGNCKPATPCTFATADALAAPTGKDLVFVMSSGSPYAGAAISLNSAQTIAGQAISIGQALTDAGITLAPNSQTLTFPASTTPVLNNGATIVTLGGNNLVEDLSINPTAGNGILGNNITTGATIRDLTVTGTNAANGINFTGTSTGSTFNLSNIGVTTAGGNALSDVGPGAATTGGTMNATQNNTTTVNTLTSTTGIALNLVNSTIGASGVTFRSISSNGASSGIVVNNTGTTGGLTITGNGGTCTTSANCTGGAIQNSTTSGVQLTSTQSPSFTRLNVTDSAGGATDDGIKMTNIPGTVTIDTCAIINSPHNGITVDNNNTNMAGFNLTQSLVSCAAGQPCQPSGSIGNDGLSMSIRGTSVLTTGLINTSTFSGVRGVAVQIATADTARIGSNSGGSITNSITVQSNTFTGNKEGIDINTAQVSNLTFQVLSNTINGLVTSPGATSAQSSAVAINTFTSAGADTGPTSHTFVGKIDSNIIGTQGTKDSGAGFGSGIRAIVQGSATQGVIKINNNTIRETANADIISVAGQNGAASSPSATARFQITNNTMPAPSGSNLSLCGPANTACASNGIFVLADEGSPVCNIITGNNIYDLSTMNGNSDIYLAERAGPPAGASLTVEGTGGNSAYIQANNTLAGPVKYTDEGANTSQVAPGACGTFPAFAQPDDGGNNEETEVSSNAPAVGASNASPATFAWLRNILNPVASFAANLNFLHNSDAPADRGISPRVSKGSESVIGLSGAASAAKPVTPFSGETISFSLPVVLNVGKSVTIKYDATINVPPGAASVQTQGNVTFTGGPGGGINTTDPETGTQVPTKTNINTAITWIGVTSTDWNTASNWDFNYVPLSFSDVKVPNAAQPNQPTLSASSPTINSLNLGNTRVLTISGQTLTITGSTGSDLTLDGNINGGALSFGSGTHTIFNAGATGSITPTNTTTVLNGANVTLNNNLQMDSLTINSGGTLNISNKTLSLTGSLNNGGTFTLTGSTVVFNGSGAQTLTNTTAFNNLTINNTGGSVTLGSNATVNGTLTLTSDLTTTNSFTLTMPTSTGIIAGGADVVGNITRTNGGPSLPTGTNIAFGNPNTTLNFIVQGTVPTSINFRLTKTAPTDAATGGTNTGFPGAVHRTWLITQVGGVGFKATMQLHYLVGDLGSNVETTPGPGPTVSLRMYKYVIASPSTGWQQQDSPAFANTTIDTSSPGNHFVKYTNVTSFSPWTIGGVSPTAATSTVTGRILDDAGNPVEGAVVRLSGTQERKTITDAFGNYSFAEVETNGFYTVTPSRVNYNFAPATRGFSALGAHTEASFAAAFNGNHQNPLDTTEYFVRQQYVDFLGREPEEKGFNDWTDTINNCAGDASCDRVHVSEMFFRSEEFQQRGYFVYRFYSTAFGQKPDYAAFAPDLGRVSGFLDATQLEAAKTQFANDFTMRPAFINQYGTMSNSQYVDALAQTAGVTLSNRQALVNSLEAGTMTRAQALRQIAESGEVYAKYYNQAFVVMEYFGYLRRDPDALYLNWISVLDANPADSRHMVEGFVDATEYRNRFKQ